MVSFNLTIVLLVVKTEAKYRDVAPLKTIETFQPIMLKVVTGVVTYEKWSHRDV